MRLTAEDSRQIYPPTQIIRLGATANLRELKRWPPSGNSAWPPLGRFSLPS
jgi:hypothetical protein